MTDRPTPSTHLPAGPLGIPLAIVGYVVAIIPALLAPLLVAPFLGAGQGGTEDRSYLALPLQFILMFVLGAALVRLWLRRRWTPEALGLTLPSRIGPWLLGVAGGVAFVVIGQVATLTSSALTEAGSKVAAQVGIGESVLRDVTIILSMAVLAPLGEEMIYRGVLFRGLHDAFARSSFGWVRTLAYAVPALLSAVVFALSHGGEGQSTQSVFLVIAGLIYAWLYWWTGSLTIAVFAHSITNAINVVLLATGGRGLTAPVLWLLVAVTPFLAVGAMWLLRRAAGVGARG